MKTAASLAVLAFAASSAATVWPDSFTPSCAKPCISSVVTPPKCNGDLKCLCQSSDYLNAVDCYLENQCTNINVQLMQMLATQVCRLVGVTVQMTCVKTSATSLSTSSSSTSIRSLASTLTTTTPSYTSTTAAGNGASTSSKATTSTGPTTTNPSPSSPSSSSASMTYTYISSALTSSSPTTTSTGGGGAVTPNVNTNTASTATTSSSSNGGSGNGGPGNGGNGNGGSGSGGTGSGSSSATSTSANTNTGASSITATTVSPTSAPVSTNPTSASTQVSSVEAKITSSLTSSAIPTPTTVPSSGGYSWAGCFTEATNGNRALNQTRWIDPQKMTVPSCVAFCKGLGLGFAGVEYSQECWCGDAIEYVNGAAKAPNGDGRCQMPCVGDISTLCGGWAMIDIYQAGGS